ncbi:basic phospholipase A2 Cdr-13-like isoform X2 [Coturnix japonica]|uniref:basic phospholipase A2 Cdr-13-like isoform X2 n=1 Tax=Coturnix japonica TaxID=93934 RepID=UPI0013A5DDE8|nr:basic phospholipase A2 Cdr-13-like isoform X2 [Coturnix japonica]
MDAQDDLVLGSSSRAAGKMNALLALAVLFAWGSSLAGGSLWQLHKVVTKMTGKNAVLYYSSYGCYCGMGGRGQPKDATDSLQHYHCNAKQQHYRYSWRGGRLTCNNDLWCAQLSCECDRSLGLCLQRSTWSYKWRYVLYPKRKCR